MFVCHGCWARSRGYHTEATLSLLLRRLCVGQGTDSRHHLLFDVKLPAFTRNVPEVVQCGLTVHYPLSRIASSYTMMFGIVDGTNKRDRTCIERMDDIVSWCNTGLQELNSLAQDRRRWNLITRQAMHTNGRYSPMVPEEEEDTMIVSICLYQNAVEKVSSIQCPILFWCQLISCELYRNGWTHQTVFGIA